MKTRALLLLCAFAAVVSAGCMTPGGHPGAPTSFRQGQESQWVVFEVKEGITYDEAWHKLFALLAKRFDIEVFSKEEGYIKTAWMGAGTGPYRNFYHTRAVAKLSPDGKLLEIKTEAESLSFNPWGGQPSWVSGVDDEVLKTLKTDIMGTLARTTR